MNEVRKASVAGMFYPEGKNELDTELTLLLSQTKIEKKFENIFGIIVPHAGYIYSGKTAAFAYNAIAGKKFKKIIVISPSHREYFKGISIYDGEFYRTPLGDVKVNVELRDELIEKSDYIFAGKNGHGPEHALEVQIPFLQKVLDNFEIIPIVMGDQSRKYVDALGKALAEIEEEETLIVVSSDLSHFYSREEAEQLDQKLEIDIERMDYEELQTDLERKNCEACGGGGIAALLKAAQIKGKENVKILARTDSAEITGDTSEVVGYLSAVVY